DRETAEQGLMADEGEDVLPPLLQEVDQEGDATRGDEAPADFHGGLRRELGVADLAGLHRANEGGDDPGLGSGIVAERPGARDLADATSPLVREGTILVLDAGPRRQRLSVSHQVESHVEPRRGESGAQDAWGERARGDTGAGSPQISLRPWSALASVA